MANLIHLRTQLTEEFNILFKADAAGDILHLLNQGGYSFEITFEQGLGKGSVPLGFVFSGQFLRTRLELAHARKTHKIVARPPRTESAQDLANISKKLLTLYDQPLFRPIDSLLLSSLKAKYHETSSDKAENSETWELNFEVDGVWLMGIFCSRYSTGEFEVDIDDAITEPKDILQALPSEANFLRLPEQSWFSKLNPKTQFFVRVGTSLAEKIYLNSDKSGLEDFSPLLLSFVKAVELQIAVHYNAHSTSLIRISEIIIRARLLSNGNGTKSKVIRDLRGLNELASKIQKHKEDYYPSGTLPLYYLLKFYALRTSIDHLVFDPYLDPDKTSKLPQDEHGLDWLRVLGYNRNDFVHQSIIDSEHEFLMYYDRICRVLKLLVELDDDVVANDT